MCNWRSSFRQVPECDQGGLRRSAAVGGRWTLIRNGRKRNVPVSLVDRPIVLPNQHDRAAHRGTVACLTCPAVSHEAKGDLPIAEVSRHAVREKSIRHGHPTPRRRRPQSVSKKAAT